LTANLDTFSADSEYLSVTTEASGRFYLRLKADAESGQPDLKDTVRSGRSVGLCGVPYSELLEQAITENSRLSEVGTSPLLRYIRIAANEEETFMEQAWYIFLFPLFKTIYFSQVCMYTKCQCILSYDNSTAMYKFLKPLHPEAQYECEIT
jgi:hypothetical protein